MWHRRGQVHDDVASSWLSPGHAPRLGDARVSYGARVNLGAGRTARPFGWKGPQPRPSQPFLAGRRAYTARSRRWSGR